MRSTTEAAAAAGGQADMLLISRASVTAVDATCVRLSAVKLIRRDIAVEVDFLRIRAIEDGAQGSCRGG